jgi:hypothetical protein
MRNRICFEGKKLKNTLEIANHACALIKFWAGLQKEADKEMLIKVWKRCSRSQCNF